MPSIQGCYGVIPGDPFADGRADRQGCDDVFALIGARGVFGRLLPVITGKSVESSWRRHRFRDDVNP